MWYEILPAAGIMFGAMTLAMYGTQFVPWVYYGHRIYKDIRKPGSVYMYHRDEQLDGLTQAAWGAYRPKGLENIPDEPLNNTSS